MIATGSRPAHRVAIGGLAGVKAAILAITVASLAVPSLHEFAGEAMTGRIAVYIAAVLVLPALTLLRGRPGYPLLADWFLMMPVAFDVVGNSLHLYGHVDHYDDGAHLVGLAFSAAFAAALLPFAAALLRGRVSGRLALAGVAVAGGLVIGVGIELVEFVLFSHTQATGLSAYNDTIGDLAMDLLGAALAATLVLVLPARQPQTAASSRLRPMAAFTSAPSTSARLVSQSQVSVMMTPASDPQALL
jgi:hypothetical protein